MSLTFCWVVWELWRAGAGASPEEARDGIGTIEGVAVG